MAGNRGGIKERVELTGASLVRKMREAVQPMGKRGTWLRFLDDQQLAEVYHRLKLGQSSNSIAVMIQEEWGLRKKAQTRSMSRAIRKFRDDMAGEIEREVRKNAKQSVEDAKKILEQAKNTTDKLDGLGRLRWLINLQTDRVAILYEREKAAIPFKFTDNTVQTLGTLISMYIDKQIKMGILDSKPSEFNVNLKHRFDGLMQNTLQGGGVAMIDMAHRYLEAAEEEALTLTLKPMEDGTYEAMPTGGGDDSG